jgi:hypothetical protein
MKDITKYLTGLAAAALVTAAAVPSQAAFTSIHIWPALTASATTGGTQTVDITNVTIKNIVGNGTVGQIGWTNPLPGAGFLVANQYIQLDTNISKVNGGVQIYTDNTNAAASPQYPVALVSTFTATPAGLIGTSPLNDQKLPTAWRASTFTLTDIVASGAGNDPNNAADPKSFLWFFHEDKAQVAVYSSSATSFGTGGDPYVTVYAAPGTPLIAHSFGPGASLANNGNEITTVIQTTSLHSGVHFAQNPTSFGGFKSGLNSTYIYTEADFTGALAGVTYSTNRLFLEAFSL